MKILLICHTVGPNRGSEPGTAWNLAWQLAGEHSVSVIAHPQHSGETDEYLKAISRPNLKFVWVNVNPKYDTWNPKTGEKGLKLHYVLWQRAAARKAMEMCDAGLVDVAH